MADFLLADWLDKQLDARGTGSAERLAEKSGLPTYTITKLRNGTSKGTWDTLSALARGFDMTRGQLVAAVDGDELPPSGALDRTETAIRRDARLLKAEADRLIDSYHAAIGRGRRPLPPLRSADTP